MNHLQRVFPIYAQMISGEVGVNVVIQGNRAFFHGPTRTIHLPALPLDNPEVAEAAWGYQYHESFHASDSDMELVYTVTDPLRKKLLNQIEDLWVESEQPRRFKTAKAAIDAMNRMIMNEGGFPVLNSDHKPSEIFTEYVLLQGIAYHNNLPELQDAADQQRAVFLEVFPRSVLVRLNALMTEFLPKIQSTADSLALVDQIIKMLEEEEEDQNNQQNQQSQQSQNNQSSGDGDSDDADGDDADGDDADGDGDDDSQGQGQNPSNSDDGDGDSDDSDSGEQQDDQNGQGSGGKAIRQVLDAGEDDLPEDKSKVIESKLGDEAVGNYRVAKPAPSEGFKSGKAGDRIFANAQVASAAARKHLQRLMQDAYNRAPKLKDRGSRIDQNRMHRAMFGDNKVFRDRGRRLQKDTAFHLMIDLSGSMSKQVQVTLEAATALGLALERIKGVSLAISRFPVDGSHQGINYSDDVQPLIRNGELLAPNMDRFNITTMGTTPLANALWFGYSELMALESPRKIMIVLTDGSPDNASSVKDVYNWSQQAGIETVGIGINSDAASDLFDVAERIDSVNDLDGALFNLTRNALLAA